MSKELVELAAEVLSVLANLPRDAMGRSETDGETLSKVTGLAPAEINDAVTLLVKSGYVEWRRTLGTAPYIFRAVEITTMGRYELERASPPVWLREDGEPPKADRIEIKLRDDTRTIAEKTIVRPPVPIGSPYGFTDEDWEFIAERKDSSSELVVVIGFQFQSEYYDIRLLQKNVESMFRQAVDAYNSLPDSIPIKLVIRPLAAGYGEHLFNEIARDIIGADIAVFETSDNNSNVMIEMGVALTWGIRVLPIKRFGRSKPPSDISGQTWIDYEDSGAHFLDPDHSAKLIRMVERAARKKGSRIK